MHDSVVKSRVCRFFRRRPLFDHLHLQFPAGFFPIRRINVPNDYYRTIVLIHCGGRWLIRQGKTLASGSWRTAQTFFEIPRFATRRHLL